MPVDNQSPVSRGYTSGMNEDAPLTRDERAQLADLLSGISSEAAYELADWLGIDLDDEAPPE